MRRTVILALALSAAFAAPARAADSYRLHAGPLAVHGYAMTVDVSTFENTASLDVTFRRTGGGVRQTHAYSFLKRVRLTAPRNLRTGRVRAALGTLGRIDLGFRRTGAVHRTKQLPGCGGPKPRRRLGRLTGTFRFKVDTTFFGTVRASRLRAALTRVPAGVHCTGAIPFEGPPGPLTLFAGDQQRASFEVRQLSADGRSRQTFVASTNHPDAVHTLVATGPSGSFIGSQDAATVVGAAPAFSGTLTYAATSHTAGPPPSTAGRLTGALIASFDSIGAQAVPTNEDAAMSGQ